MIWSASYLMTQDDTHTLLVLPLELLDKVVDETGTRYPGTQLTARVLPGRRPALHLLRRIARLLTLGSRSRRGDRQRVGWTILAERRPALRVVKYHIMR